MKSDKIYVHIGTHKTGSTALQIFLYQNSKILERSGIHYPTLAVGVPYHIQHASLAYQLRSGDRLGFYKFISDSIKEGKVLLLSSEAFLEKDQYGMAKDLEELKEYANVVKVIVYLRRQDHLFESAYQEIIKDPRSRYRESFENYLTYKRKAIFANGHWISLLNFWASVFGKENLIVRPYEKEQFVDGSIFADFLSIFDLKLASEFIIPQRNHSNVGFDRDLIELIRLSNPFRSETEQQSLLRLLYKSLGEGRLKADKEENGYICSEKRIEFLNEFVEGNERVAREYLNREDGCLFYEPWPEPNEKEEPYKLTLERVAPILVQLVFHLYLNQEQFENRVNQLSNQLLKQKGHPREIEQYAPVSAAELERLRQEITVLKQQLDRPLSSGKELQRELTQVRQELIKANQQQAIARNQLHAIQNSLTWRISRAAISKAEKGRMLSKVLQLLRQKMDSISMLK